MNENEPQIDPKEVLSNELKEMAVKFGFEKDESVTPMEDEIKKLWEESKDDIFSDEIREKVGAYQEMCEKVVEKAIEEGKGENPNLGKNIDYALFVYTCYKGGNIALKDYCNDTLYDVRDNADQEYQDEVVKKIEQLIQLLKEFNFRGNGPPH